jgi:hypothetical protein
MRCHQCPKPAMYVVPSQQAALKEAGAGIPLCLDCWHKWQHGGYMLFLQNAAMMNQAADDLDSFAGFSTTGGRIPVGALAKAAEKKGPVYNNIRISNSTVGVLNTGDLARIDAVITLTKDTDVEAIGQTLMKLTQAIIDAKEIEQKAKRELVELIQSLAEQVVGSQRQRKPSVIMTLLHGIEQRAAGIVALSTIVQQLVQVVTTMFGGG